MLDDNDTCLITKKFWKYVQSKTKSTRIPETIWYDKCRTKPIDQANMFSQFFYDQFSEQRKYDIDIDMNIANDQFNDIEVHALDVLLLLKNINPDGIHGMVLKNCSASLATPLAKLFKLPYMTGMAVYLKIGN